MRRLNYISSFSKALSNDEIDKIANKSVENNKRDGITGVLFCFNDIFYQILEGDEDKVSECYDRILKDSRHTNIFCLEIEENIRERRYEGWHMKTVRLEEANDPMIIPIRSMLNSLAKTHSMLKLYTPFEVLDGIQKGQDPSKLEPYNTEKVIIFSDIVSSTLLHEKLSPRQMNEILTRFYNIAIPTISNNGGTVSKLTGDGLMAYFDINSIDIAINSALLIQKALGKLRKKNKDNILSLLYAGIGISSGKIRMGNIGSEKMKEYTLLGDSVNRAARLEGLTRNSGYNIILDDTIYNKISDKKLIVKHLGKFTPQGKTIAFNIYTIDEIHVCFNKVYDEIKSRVDTFVK